MAPAKSRTRTSAVDIRPGLITAGRRILERDGVTGLTIRAVAAEAGVAPMGVYNHFDGKDGLLGAVVSGGFTEFAVAIDTTDDDATTRLRRSGEAYRRFALANPVLYGLMFSGTCAVEPASTRTAFEVLVEIIRYGQASGIIMAGDPRSIAMQVWSCVHGAVSLELSTAQAPGTDADDNYEQVLRLVARGVAG